MTVLTRERRSYGVAPPASGGTRWEWRGELMPLVALMLVTLIGGALRRYHLGQQGLWFDEADLVIRAREPWGHLFANFVRPGENGPLYTLGLSLWMHIAGTSEAAVRLPSALFGTLAIPALYGLGRELRGPRLGLIAAAFLALSPFAHWYAQDAKMYSLVILTAIATTWLLLVALRRGGRWWAAYVIVGALGVFVHAAVTLVLVAQVVIVAVLWRRGIGTRPGKRQGQWLFALAVVVALPFVVWGGAFLVHLGPTWQPEATPWAIVGTMLNEFGATHRADANTQTEARWLYLALAMLGIVLTSWAAHVRINLPAANPLSWRERVRGRRVVSVPVANMPFQGYWTPGQVLLIVGCCAAVPVLLFSLLSLRRAIFADRYLIVALPGYLLLVALGLDGVLHWRIGWLVAAVSGVALVALAWIPLSTVNLSAQSQKEDWREAYRHIAEHARPGDGVLVAPGYLRTTYDYYALRFPALRALPVAEAPSLAPALDVSERSLVSFFQTNTHGWQRVWLLRSDTRAPLDDPTGRIPAFLSTEATIFESEHLNGVLLDCAVYGKPYDSTGFIPQVLSDVRFGDSGIVLNGASWQTQSGANRVARGTFAPLLLQWFAPDPSPRADYTVLVRLVDAGGREVGQYDIPPLDGHWPTSTWLEKQNPFYDPHDLHIAADLPSGEYRLLVGLAPTADTAHPLPAFAHDGTRVDTDGLVQVLTLVIP